MKFLNIALPLIMAASTSAQAFSNLDFDTPRLPPYDPEVPMAWLDWSVALPGWDHGGGPDTQTVYHNASHVGLTPFYTLAENEYGFPYRWSANGRFSVVMKNGYDWADEPGGETGEWIQSYLSQSGTVPLGTRSLLLGGIGPIQLYFGGQAIDLISIGQDAWAADMSGFAGQSGVLRIANASQAGDHRFVMLDAIEFSTAPIPEPSELALLGTGLALVATRRFRRIKAKRQATGGPARE